MPSTTGWQDCTAKTDMERTQHPSNNDVLGAPAGWDQDRATCNALPITRTEMDGIPCMMSFWRPTAEELAALNAGHLVVLCVLGAVHPPVLVAVEAR